MTRPNRYLLLPAHGLQSSTGPAGTAATDTLLRLTSKQGTAEVRNRLRSVIRTSATRGRREISAAPFNVVASLNEDGVKLVEATPDMIAALRFERPGLRVVPELFYRRAVMVLPAPRKGLKPATAHASATKKLAITVVNASNGDPVAGVRVVAFTDYAREFGVEATTTSKGKVTLRSNAKLFERLYVQHELPGLWTYFRKNVATNGVMTIALAPVDLSAADSLRHFHDIGGDLSVGSGVRVGVIDSGVDTAHPDLRVTGGLGCVPGSPGNQFGASGSHGTHVAGIIAGRGAAPTGLRGIAPGVELFSYRVFDDSPDSGSNFGIVKAIRRAIDDHCDLVNMSLAYDHDENTGKPNVDEAVKDAIAEAHAAGIVVVAAAGNDNRKEVAFPASDDLAVAVSAVGRKQSFPSRSSEAADVAKPLGTDKKDFLAAFSNVGAALDVAGAGVGVVSTVPGGHAPMSGTSMACPAVTGVLARLLSLDAKLLSAPRDASRADAIKSLLYGKARSLGMGLDYEGKGLPE